MKKKRFKWTPERDAKLRKYVGNGWSIRKIAEKLRCTVNSVNHRKGKLGLRYVLTRDPMMFPQIVKFRMAGWTQEKIAEIFGITGAHVSLILTEKGFKGAWDKRGGPRSRQDSWTELEIHRLRQSHRSGESTKDLQAKYFPNRTLSAIYTKRYQLTRHYLPQSEIDKRERQRRRFINRTELYIRED